MAIYPLAFPDGTPYPTIPAGTSVVNVSTSNALVTALSNATAGQRIVLANGTYSGAFSMSGRAGTATAGISVEAANVGGALIASGSSFRITNCTYVTVSGLMWNWQGSGETIQFRGTSHHCRWTRSTLGPTSFTESAAVQTWIFVGDDCYHIRIDHNEIRNKGTSGNGVRVYGSFAKVDAGQGSSAGCRWVRIDHNAFRAIKPEVGNDKEPVRYGVSTMSRTIANGVIERNVFHDCVCEPEVISVKMGGIRTTGNTILQSIGGPVIRHGTNSIMSDNYVIDDPAGSGPPPAPTQTLGVGGVATPPGAILTTGNSTSTLTITTSGTASAQRVYDGQGFTVKKIDIAADYVTVQNFRIRGAGNSGVYSIGTGNVIQNNDIAQVTEGGVGDINGITFFGNGHKILYNAIGESDFLVSGALNGAHTDGIQTWNTPSKRASSTVTIKGNHITGPPQSDERYIHQGVMAQGKAATDGGGGGTGTSTGWLVEGNYFKTYGNQCLKFDDVHNVQITKNHFDGACNKIVATGDFSTGITFGTDNIITGNYGSQVGD
jgi:hypothetical protein